MEQFNQILFSVWREACRDIQLERSCTTITQMLSSHMPINAMMIRGLNNENKMLETLVLTALDSAETYASSAVSHYDTDDWKAIRRFCHQGIVLRKSDASGSPDLFQIFIPDSKDRDILIGPLKMKDDLGVIFILSKRREKFADKHTQLLKILLEPLSIALSNDLRLKEINTLREAAEADKLSLLQKLSRKSLTDTIIGADHGLKQVMERVSLVARSDVPVMILGETGTGKELISREIHRLSSRSSGPFIRVNCGSIPSELIDSQLFGHEKGSFTGAISTHHGWFERAHGGTLFLDEIGELPLAGQVRLLRIIQDGWLERIGGKQPIHVDVRLVIATHQDLAAMVRKGEFREDLWYRLSVFPILLPALRDRTDDIRTLANHFAEKAAIRFNLPVQLPTENDIQLLIKYSWPGNIRELGSVVDRAAILGDGHGLKIETALGWINNSINKQDAEKELIPDQSIKPLDNMIKHHIEQTLIRTHGRVEGPLGAARLLGMNPNTLRSKMRKLGINRKKFLKMSRYYLSDLKNILTSNGS